MVQKVLIATDGSDHAKKAVAFGANIAAKYDAEVVLVHVLLRDELSEDLRDLADVEYHAGEGGRPLSEAIAMIPQGRVPLVDIKPKTAQTPGEVLRAVADQTRVNAAPRESRHVPS